MNNLHTDDKLSKSFLATFWVTSDCNLECKYCYEGNNKKNLYMRDEVIERAVEFILEKVKTLNCTFLDIHFHGGEPLLGYDGIQKIFKFLEEHKTDELHINYTITTNATLIDEANIEFLSRNINDISVSIDGIKESHDMNRLFINGQESHDVVIQNSIKLLKKRNINARMTITSNNVCYLYQSVSYLIQSGFKTIITSVNYFDKEWQSTNIELLLSELKKIKNYIKDLGKCGENIKISLVNDIRFKKKGNCSGGINIVHIDPLGNIYPCSYTVGQSEFKCGSVFTGIDNMKLDELHKENETDIKECNNCGYYSYCISKRCKMVNKCVTGDYLKPSPVICAVERIKLQMRDA